MHSKKQLWTIKNFGTIYMSNTQEEARSFGYDASSLNCNNKVLHGGVAGCGKTYCIEEAFGVYCSRLEQLKIKNLNFILMGQSRKMVETNQCSVLSRCFGSNFKFDNGRKDGLVKDAKLFGQNLFFVGLNDSKSEERIRGMSDIMGIIHDEATLCKEEQLALVFARLRGELRPDVKNKLPKNFLRHWYVGSTNPDGPNHFLKKKYVESGLMKYVPWYMSDACYEGAEKYYRDLLIDYKDCPSLLQRFLYGKWVGSDALVYPNFRMDRHMCDWDDDWLKEVKRTIIGIDAGSNHPTAIVVVCLTHEGQYIVNKEYKLKHTAPSMISQELGYIWRILVEMGANMKGLYIDPAALWLKEQLQADGFNPISAKNSHEEGIGYIRTLLSRGDLLITRGCQQLKNEFLTYSFKGKDTDTLNKIDDDLVDAVRYAVYTDHILYGEG